MKIAILGHLKFPIGPPFAGGLERHTHALATGLRRRGHAVTLFASAGSDPALRSEAVCAPTGALTGDPAGDAAITAAEDAAYERMMEAVAAGGFDLVHANCLSAVPLREGRRLPPMVVALHVGPFEPFAGALRAGGSRLAVVAVSRQLADRWRDATPEITVIPNGVDLRTFAPPERRAAGPRPYVFWSGRIAPEKGLHLAIDAARLAGLDLSFAGPRGEPAYWHREIAPRLGPGIRDFGHLDEDALVRLLGEAQAAVITPRWEEPFGLVVIEALACGTPVAAFARGAVPDLVDEATGRLAAPDDVPGLAGAIVAATALDRAACRARAEARFGLDAMLSGYEALYRRLSRKP